MYELGFDRYNHNDTDMVWLNHTDTYTDTDMDLLNHIHTDTDIERKKKFLADTDTRCFNRYHIDILINLNRYR